MTAQIHVRMYRTGFGDCFLLSFGRKSTASHVLIDFGAHMHGDIGTMDAVMNDIEDETKKKLAVIVASHAHRDHISGFGKYALRFKEFEIGEVWMPWTDDPSNADATALQRKHLALYDRLENHLRLTLGAKESDDRYAPALHALSNLRGNGPAMAALRSGFDTDAEPRYLRAGDVIRKAGGIAGLSAQILAPPSDLQFFSRMDPPAHQRYLNSPSDLEGAIRPFPGLEIRRTESDFKTMVEKEGLRVLDTEDEKELRALAEAPADRLALVLDNVRNNTSLVIHFRYDGRSLLFPGDAQWGNWQSWIDTDDAQTLLRELDFLKVSHHGSDNATPVGVVEALRESGMAAMMSTQVLPYPTIPRMPLVEKLAARCCGVVMRSDWIRVDGAPAIPAPKRELPYGAKVGRLWIDYELNPKRDDTEKTQVRPRTAKTRGKQNVHPGRKSKSPKPAR